jgi:excisionase family DNA binding protein
MARGRRKRPPIDVSASPLGVMYDTMQVAAFMGVTPRTVQRWIREGRLPAMIVGGTYRVKREDLQGFVKSR